MNRCVTSILPRSIDMCARCACACLARGWVSLVRSLTHYSNSTREQYNKYYSCRTPTTNQSIKPPRVVDTGPALSRVRAQSMQFVSTSVSPDVTEMSQPSHIFVTRCHKLSQQLSYQSRRVTECQYICRRVDKLTYTRCAGGGEGASPTIDHVHISFGFIACDLKS